MKNVIRSLAPVLVLLAGAPFAHAEEGTVRAMAPWEAAGEVFVIAPEMVLVQGRFTGILYVEHPEKEVLDAMLMRCPANVTLDAASEKLVATGHCTLRHGDGDAVYAKWTCEGVPGQCAGDLEFTGGSGRFKGITGGGPMALRTALGATALDLGSGEVVRAAAGLAVWPELKYKFPGK